MKYESKNLMVSLTLDSPTLAAAYDATSDAQFANGLRLLAALELQPGQTVLDIGCGTGRLTRHAAALLGGRGRLTGLDPLPARVALAREKNTFANVEYRVAAGDELDFLPADSVDVVYLNAVFHWIEKQAETLAQIRRVLKPGGRLGLATGAHELNRRNPLQTVTASVLQSPPFNLPPERLASTPHRVTTTQLIELLLAAGLTVSEARVHLADRVFPDPTAVLAHSEASSFGNYLKAVPDGLKGEARARLQAALARRQTPRGIALPHHTIFALAEKTADGECNDRHTPLQFL
jgi:ubiquinone/menaquinone biosynthesis C-methylase UbiE